MEYLLFSEDDQWYRASVLAYASEQSVLVGYVDYGNFEILSLTRLCPITPKLLELPMQAIKCVLAGKMFLWPHILKILKPKVRALELRLNYPENKRMCLDITSLNAKIILNRTFQIHRTILLSLINKFNVSVVMKLFSAIRRVCIIDKYHRS